MNLNQEITLKLTVADVDVIMQLINEHPPAPLVQAHALFTSLQMQVAEQMKKQEKTE